MSANRALFHVYIQPSSKSTFEQIEKKLDLAIDWIKYTDGCYMIDTRKSMTIWNDRLKPLAKENGNMLILDIDPHQYKGWMPKSIWTWLKSKKEKIN